MKLLGMKSRVERAVIFPERRLFGQMAPLDHVSLTNPDSQAIRARPCVEDSSPLLLK
jgi:hypothetical protein